MKKLPAISAVIGDPGVIALESRIFNAVTLLIAVVGLATLLGNHFNHLPFSQSIICVFCIVVGIFGYGYSRRKGSHSKIAGIMALLFLLLLVFSWFPSGGSTGTIIFFFFVLTVFVMLIVERPFKMPFLFITTVVMGVLLYLEYSKAYQIFEYTDVKQRFFDFILGLVICVPVVGIVTHIVFEEYIKERTLKAELIMKILEDKRILEKAAEEIKILRGCLPICANCKKIRDDKGSWNHIETYISAHSHAEFTHSLCPECAKKLYGFEPKDNI